MKKFKVLVLLISVMLLTACGTKRVAIDEDKFIKIMTDEGFNIVNVEEQFEVYGYFEEAYVALESNNNYQIEFYELEDDNYAQSFYETNKEIFEASKTGTSLYTDVNLNNTSKYTLTTEDEYKVISRVEETVIYLSVDKEYKEEVTDILKKLGY